METANTTTGSNNVYALWHLPSSALLLSTGSRTEVQRRIAVALADGFPLDDLMLQVTTAEDLVGVQHLGTTIPAALTGSVEPDTLPSGL